MYCKFSFLMLFFILLHTYLACETPNHKIMEYVDILNRIRERTAWHGIKGVTVGHINCGRMDINILTSTQISEENYIEYLQCFSLFVSCRYVQQLKMIKGIWKGFMTSCKSLRPKDNYVNFSLCVNKLHQVIKKSRSMLADMAQGLFDMERLFHNKDLSQTNYCFKNHKVIMHFRARVCDFIDLYPNPLFMVLMKNHLVYRNVTDDVFEKIADLIKKVGYLFGNINENCSFPYSSITFGTYTYNFKKLCYDTKMTYCDNVYIYALEKIGDLYDDIIDEEYRGIGLEDLNKKLEAMINSQNPRES